MFHSGLLDLIKGDSALLLLPRALANDPAKYDPPQRVLVVNGALTQPVRAAGSLVHSNV